MEKTKILLVEDEPDLAEPLVAGLEDEGYSVHRAATGKEALRNLDQRWDLVILDLMLPDLGGEAILSYVKSLPCYPPVLVLTARDAIQDKLSLFRQGCDDYLTKPYVFEEIVERVKALLRRSPRVETTRHSYEDLVLDPVTHRLVCSDGAVVLTPKESNMIRILLDKPGKVVSRVEILVGAWGMKEEPDTNFIGVHLFNLRKKLAQVGRDSWLQTVRSSGFRLSNPSSSAHEH